MASRSGVTEVDLHAPTQWEAGVGCGNSEHPSVTPVQGTWTTFSALTGPASSEPRPAPVNTQETNSDVANLWASGRSWVAQAWKVEWRSENDTPSNSPAHPGSGHGRNSGGSPEGTRIERPRLPSLRSAAVLARRTEPGHAVAAQSFFVTSSTRSLPTLEIRTLTTT
jgi:hypothetical protein